MNLTEALAVLKSRLKELNNAMGTAEYIPLFQAFLAEVKAAGLFTQYSGVLHSYIVALPAEGEDHAE